MKTANTFATLQSQNEWLECNPFQKFKLTFTKTSRQFLMADEMSTIEKKEFKIQFNYKKG